MRSPTEIKNLILEFAKGDDRVRAVLLNGSRANSNIKPDRFQDFDILFVVNDIESFTIDHSWTDFFGKKIVFQLPDEMTFVGEIAYRQNIRFTYLMLFEDANRIDLTLFSVQKIASDFKPDSLTILWLDKDKLFVGLPPSDDKDYHVKVPAEKEFLDTCNEFWWVSTNVVKGLSRREIIYAKNMLETVIRPMFMKVIEWRVGIENDFTVSMGKSGKFLKTYLSHDCYNKVLHTYSDSEPEANWKSLLLMAKMFQQTSHFVADRLGFCINKMEEQNTMSYLRNQHENHKKLSKR